MPIQQLKPMKNISTVSFYTNDHVEVKFVSYNIPYPRLNKNTNDNMTRNNAKDLKLS